MGYYTDFTLDYKGDLPQEQLLSAFDDTTGYSLEDFPFLTGVKWYDHISDMVALSKRFPKVLFTLQGSGEDSDDLFHYQFFNGTYSGGQAEIIYPPIDSSFTATVKRTIPEHYI